MGAVLSQEEPRQLALQNWLRTPIGAAVQHYIGRGFAAFPMHGINADRSCTCGNPQCSSPGKHPACLHGVRDATKDIYQAASLFRHLGKYNVALACGEPSGFFAVDIDSAEGEAVIAQYELPPTTIFLTGRGRHILFKYPGYYIASRQIVRGVEIKGDGGSIHVPPSKHASGKDYQVSPDSSDDLAEAPAWLLELIKPVMRAPVLVSERSGAIPEWKEDQVQSMLGCLDPDMSYEDWVKIGMALHDGGYALSMWDAWSREGKKYEPRGCATHWRSFNTGSGITMGTLVDMAKVRGWAPVVEMRIAAPVIEVDVEALVMPKKASIILPAPAALRMLKTRPMPDPLELPGMIGDTVRWITRHAIFPQPLLAMLNTIAFAGAVFGRRYTTTPHNTRTNIYTVGTADTAAGKDHSRKMIIKLATESGLKGYIGSNSIRSDTGLLRSLANNASQLLMLDEFGLFLQALTSPTAPYHIRCVTKTLMSLYSDSGSTYHHGDYADRKIEPIIIANPNLCVYGTTTESSYIPSLRKTTLESGELNRFIILPGQKRPRPIEFVPEIIMDPRVLSSWSRFVPLTIGSIVNSASVMPEIVKVSYGDCERIPYELLQRQTDYLDTNDPAKTLWGRFTENITKIAMIFAIARNPFKPVTTREDWDIGEAIVGASVDYLSSVAREGLAETDHEALHHELVRVLRDAGGSMSRSDLFRHFRRIKRKELDDLLSGMQEQDVITAMLITPVDSGEKTGGRRKTVYALL